MLRTLSSTSLGCPQVSGSLPQRAPALLPGCQIQPLLLPSTPPSPLSSTQQLSPFWPQLPRTHGANSPPFCSAAAPLPPWTDHTESMFQLPAPWGRDPTSNSLYVLHALNYHHHLSEAALTQDCGRRHLCLAKLGRGGEALGPACQNPSAEGQPQGLALPLDASRKNRNLSLLEQGRSRRGPSPATSKPQPGSSPWLRGPKARHWDSPGQGEGQASAPDVQGAKRRLEGELEVGQRLVLPSPELVQRQVIPLTPPSHLKSCLCPWRSNPWLGRCSSASGTCPHLP